MKKELKSLITFQKNRNIRKSLTTFHFSFPFTTIPFLQFIALKVQKKAVKNIFTYLYNRTETFTKRLGIKVMLLKLTKFWEFMRFPFKTMTIKRINSLERQKEGFKRVIKNTSQD